MEKYIVRSLELHLFFGRITGCQIRSVILPLLADHVLREANHYLRLLISERNVTDQ